MTTVKSICLLGFGEVGQTLLPALLKLDCELSAFDKQFSDADSGPSKAADAISRLNKGADAATAVQSAQLVISAVTAEQSLPAAQATVAGLQAGTWFLDLNSASPGTRRETAAAVKKTGARYVEASVMAPIAPKGIEAPILLGGPHAESFLPLAQALGFSGSKFFSEELGKTAAAKMCRSVMIKGLESLLTESLLSARHYGVEDIVLASLSNLMPGVDWQEHAAYMISRSLEHGVRRAEEMREVSRTVREAGLVGAMSSACAETQEWSAQFAAALEQGELNPMLDQILQMNSSTKR